ncbi:MAG: hypothetical protein ACPIOQ_04965 [Promethearchaeia archaeon]
MEFQEDGLHLTASAARLLGERLAEAVWNLDGVRAMLQRRV